MAHFAQLDENNVVVTVLVIANGDILDENGNESEEKGVELCKALYGGYKWLQTSYNNNFRKNYAVIGGTYDPVRDAFLYPVPESNEFVFDEETCRWNFIGEFT